MKLFTSIFIRIWSFKRCCVLTSKTLNILILNFKIKKEGILKKTVLKKIFLPVSLAQPLRPCVLNIFFVGFCLFSLNLLATHRALRVQPIKNQTIESHSSLNRQTLQTQKQDINKWSALTLHNQSLQKLETTDHALALIGLRINFYENLFFPSYLVLKSLKAEVSVSPFLWQIGLLVFALISVLGMFLYFKSNLFFKSRIKIFFLWFFGLTILAVSGFLQFKPRVSNLNELDLLNAPFQEALVLKKIEKGSDLIVLKKQGDWLQVKNQKQKGWVLKTDVLSISK